MPFYEYECRSCGEHWSVLLTIGQRDEVEPTLACPECGVQGPRRLISGFAASTGGTGATGGPPPACGSGGG